MAVGDAFGLTRSVSGLPIVDSLPVSTFPPRAGATIGARDGGVLCAEWLPTGPRTVLWRGDSLPTAGNPIALAQGDGEGPAIDSVVVPSDRSAYVRAASLTRGSGGGPLYLVTDSGVLFGIHDETTAKLLGLQGESGYGSMAGAVPITSWTRTEPGQRPSRA